MTGQGRGHAECGSGHCVAEIRSVNHRGLKVIVRGGERLAGIESRIEKRIRSRILRGTVTVQIQCNPNRDNPDDLFDVSLLEQLTTTLDKVAKSTGVNATIDLATLATHPEIAVRNGSTANATELADLAMQAVDLALDRFVVMRHQEAAHMTVALHDDVAEIRQRLSTITKLAPSVVHRHEERLRTKIEATLNRHDIESIDQIDVLREVQIFADRSDISEEITRLSGHLDMFVGILNGSPEVSSAQSRSRDALGRKLDFVVQEMFRETNTIGSKAGDGEIAAEVVEIKCASERIRELVQNLE
ncbi:MAG: DUF1732 domain-containing protein [Planctomycetota bacterium]